MASKRTQNEGEKGPDLPKKDSVIDAEITLEMRKSYLDYAMSVITSRALPDVRDGLKPVHRRILYTMHEMGLVSGAKFRKSAAIVGDVMGKYHPHGDIPIYDAMVKMAQTFSFRYPLVWGQGNFGSPDGDPPAAMRYTEAKMTAISSELLRDLEKDTVEWAPNYDGRMNEPLVLPTAVPNLLLNGTLGIAVGMATNIAPHNLKEVCEAMIHLIDHKDATTEDLLQFVKGPDFPTRGLIFADKEMKHAYGTGRGGVVVRGEAEIVETKAGSFQIVITSIPYRVNKAELVVQIADLVREKKLEGIKALRDESTRETRIVIELKNNAYPEQVLNYIYKHTQLEESFHFNMVGLVNGVPETLSLKKILEVFIKHRREVVRKRTEFDLKKAEDREHILIGLKKALDHIDEIIKLIKKSKDVEDAKNGLMKTFKFSELQALAILDMKLQKLAGLERKKIEDELEAVRALIKKLKEILSSEKNILAVVKDETLAVMEKYGDDRRTKIIRHGVKEMSDEDLIPNEDNVLVMTKGGYVKRTKPEEYRKQKRGGVGVIDLETKEEDFVTHLISGSTHSDLLFFTDKGKAYQVKMYEIPEGRRATKGKAVVNFLAVSGEERITSVLIVPKEAKATDWSLVLITKNGTGKKVSGESFKDVRRSGIIAIRLEEGDELISAGMVEKGDECILTTSLGQSIRFKESDLREMGRSAGGVRAMRLKKGDFIVGADTVKKGSKEASLLSVMENGFGKKSKLSSYKVQKRGGSGIKTAKITKKTGVLMSARVVYGDEGDEIVAMSKKGQVIRIAVSDVPLIGRQTQGVRIMRLHEGDKIASVTCL